MSVETSVIIPNWNGIDFLPHCLNSLRYQTFKEFEIIVVDNGSTDGSVDFLSRNYSDVNLVKLKTNTGFSRAINEGIRVAKGDYCLLLNNDVEADPYLIENLHGVAKNKGANFYACRMMNFYNRDIIDGAGDGYTREGKAFRIGWGEKYENKFDKIKRVFGACAGASFYRRELFDEVGLFDLDFFAYHEDTDWNFRANLMGFKCFYIPSAVVFHVGSATTGSFINEFTVFYNVRNMINVIIKNIPTPLLLKLLPKILWGQIKTFIRVSFIEGYPITYMKGIFSVVKLSPKTLRKRRKIQQSKKISNHELEELIRSSEKDSRRMGAFIRKVYGSRHSDNNRRL